MTRAHDDTGRSTGRRRSNRRTRIGGQFAPRLIEMLESSAYRALSLSAHRVLARLEIELGHHGGADNGALPVTHDDFERYGIHRHAIGAALREAEALGFIEVTERGRAGNAEFRRPNLFRITYLPTNYLGPTHEWKQIQTMEQAEGVASAARKSAAPPWRPKQKSSAGTRHVSAPETGTENPACSVAETATTVHSAQAATTSIYRGREAAGDRSIS